MKKISTYWKCQLIGWGLYAIATFIFSFTRLIHSDLILTVLLYFFVCIVDILLAHLMRNIILRFHILEKTLFIQIVSLFAVSIVFTAIAFALEIALLGLLELKNNNLSTREPVISGSYKLLFFAFVARLAWVLIYSGYYYVKKKIYEEQQKAVHEKHLWELEAYALRAQMNPHFIFNCMNSIKSLIQQKQKKASTEYLDTFSKLLMKVFQNSDKREITLYDEIETCRLYTELESMRFGNKLSYEFAIDKTLDLKSVIVPALIIQPFIENAIWHGIMPKEEGGKLTVQVSKTNHTINCIIEDDGIGRDLSKQNKFLSKDYTHESKGEHLTQARLDLDNLLNERNAKIEITDKKTHKGQTEGTTVILSFSEDQ